MARGKQYTTEQFITCAQELHGDKYDYSKVVYKNNYTKVDIVCKNHGVFQQIPSSHLLISKRTGKPIGCINCAKQIARNFNKITTEAFILKAQQIHGTKYNYSKVHYKNNYTNIEIVCSIHGSFFQLPWSHTTKKAECNKCSDIRKGAKSSRFLNLPTTLYLVKLFNEQEEFLKIGTTIQPVGVRLKTHIYPYEYNVINIETLAGKQAVEKEQKMLIDFQQEKYIPHHKFDGYTECFKYSKQNIERITSWLV